MRKLKLLSSIKFKFSVLYLSLIAFVLILMNTYFLTESRNMVFSSKQALLQNHTSVISTTLSSLESLTPESVNQAMSLFDSGSLTRVTVVSANGATIYDTAASEDASDSEDIFNLYLSDALDGFDVFYSSFTDGTFRTSAFSPIISRGMVTGVVYVFERDAEQGSLLLSMRGSVRVVSVVIATLAILVMVLLIGAVINRISSIYKAISSVRQGDYDYRVEVTGNDELSLLSEEFNDLTDRLQETEEVRKRFVADASHELKTPLASIRLLSDSILQNDSMDMETVQEFVNDIGNEAGRLARTTEKLLTLTRLDSSISDNAVCIDPANVIKNTLRMLNPMAENSSITLKSQLDDNCFILATEDDLHEIIYNLVENAIKYNNPYGHVMVDLSKLGHNVFINIDDTGIGIPESDIEHIFDRFYRVDKARSREMGGSGLGLSIVRDLVTHYNGIITASRKSGGGMRFHIKFPLYGSENNKIE